MKTKFLVLLTFLSLSPLVHAQQAEDPSCPKEHADMGHCVPKVQKATKSAGDPSCPPEHAAMGHCTPKTASTGATSSDHIHAHLNQFFIFADGSGPRGRNAVTAPNMFMLEIQKGYLSPRNSFKVDFMGTTDVWSVPAKGTPQLLQAGESDENGHPYIDAQHPHSSPIMGLTFSNILNLNEDGSKKLTFFFAPRGEATAGPETFMHRASHQGNPDAPLAHHLQDFFHITSTVVGAELVVGKVTFQGSAFSGFEPQPRKVDLDMHKLDSVGFRAKYKFSPSVSVGGSYANVKPQHAEVESHHEVEHTPVVDAHSTGERATALAAWLTTQNNIGPGTLNNTVIWGRVKSEEALNSFLEEFVYTLGSNNFIGELEVLQRPTEVLIKATDDHGAQWISALTLGYERKVFSKDSLNTYLGGTFTQNFIPSSWANSYGSQTPRSVKVFMRLGWSTNKTIGK